MSTTVTDIKELSDGNTAGTRLGQSATDLVALWGGTPVAQQTAPAAVTSANPQPNAAQSIYLMSLQSNADNALAMVLSLRTKLLASGILG